MRFSFISFTDIAGLLTQRSTFFIAIRIYVLGLGGGLLCFPVVGAEKLYFDPHSLDPRSGVAADLDVFARGEQLPGTYRVDIFLNKTAVTNRDVIFVMEKGTLHPQLKVQELADMNINMAAFPKLNALSSETIITDLGLYIPGATTHFDFSHQRLDILVPQEFLKINARNAVDPARWDQGLSAFLMNYSLNGSRNNYEQGSDTSNAFLNLGTGANLGAWRLRNNSTYTYTHNSSPINSNSTTTNPNDQDNYYDDSGTSGSQRHWQSINTYLQRDIQRLGGQLTLGEGTTSGMLFDSLLFRGALLASDDSMLPDSQRGFAPVVRGIANSSAQITVRQNGYVIYQTYVPPGPYAIRDIYATTGSGDLQVTVREENGTERSFTQPYSSVPLMQREGWLRYEFTAGQYRSTSDNAREPGFGQGNLVYGISNTTTIYGGVTGSQDYTSAMMGVGQGLDSFGSISLDVTQANTRLQDQSQHHGQSYRLQYAKDVFQSGTTFTLAGYRYSTSGFYDFNEANEIPAYPNDDWNHGYNKRSKVQIQISQTMGSYGSLYLTAYQQDYWGQTGYERNVSAGYSVSLQGISMGLSVNNSRPAGGGSSDYQYAFNVQIPLDRFLSNSWLSFATQTDNHDRASQSVTLNGQTLEDNNLNYMVRESVGNKGEGNGGGGNLSYKGTYGNAQAGYSYTRTSQQYTAGVQGGIIVHPYGVTLSQPLGDTVTLVRAPGASGVKIQNQSGVSTDWRGYAVVPYAINYHDNRVAISPASLNDNVDITDTVKTVTPTKGAVVLANFDTLIGNRVLVTLRSSGRNVPFGATANLYSMDKDHPGEEKEISSGIVGENGELYLSGVPDNAYVKVRWGRETGQICKAVLPIADVTMSSGVVITSADCKIQ